MAAVTAWSDNNHKSALHKTEPGGLKDTSAAGGLRDLNHVWGYLSAQITASLLR